MISIIGCVVFLIVIFAFAPLTGVACAAASLIAILSGSPDVFFLILLVTPFCAIAEFKLLRRYTGLDQPSLRPRRKSRVNLG